jgi:alpha-tubulin suppressor-like RCC1 family protein
MMKTLRWRSGIVLIGGTLVTMFIFLEVLNNQSVAQTAAGMVQDIAAGDQHCLALISDETMWAWGDNAYGQLGDGTHGDNRFPPVHVKNLTEVQAIDGGQAHSLAVKRDGTVWVWGSNAQGQLGIGESGDTYVYPMSLETISGVEDVAAGAAYSLALKSDGSVYAWGDNAYGQLGVGAGIVFLSPTQVKGPNGEGYLTGVQAIATGSQHSLALMSDGTVYAWGGNHHGQLGIGTSEGISNIPVQVNGPNGTGVLSDVQAIAAGTYFSLALKSDGTVWAWGGNSYGQLGTNSTVEHQSPVQVQGPGGVDVSGYLSDVKAISAGEHHSLALKRDGTVWAWGENNHGQLGTNSTHEHYTPVQVQGPGGVDVSGYLSDVKTVDGGEFFSLALKNDGTVWAWGGNYYYQIDGTRKDRTTPVQVSGLSSTNPIPVPEQALVMTFAASETPFLDSDPQQAIPIGIGPLASGGGTLRLHLGLSAFAGPVDLYFGISAPDLDPLNMCILNSDLTFQTHKDGIIPWKTNVTGSTSVSLFGEIPAYAFPPSKYYIYLAATKAGEDFSSGYYLWSTQFEMGTEDEPWWWALIGELEAANIESVCDLFSSRPTQWPR